MLALAACSSGNVADTTTTASVAPPTPPPTTTTIAPITTPTAPPPTTTAPPPTSPATTGEAGENGAAKAEIIARYEAFSAEADRCFAAPTQCDLPTVLAEFSNTDNDLFVFYVTWWTQYADLEQHVEKSEQIDRTVQIVEVDDNVALLVTCVVDARVLVDKDGRVVDDGVGRRREETFWSVTDGSWRIDDAKLYGVKESGDTTCAL